MAVAHSAASTQLALVYLDNVAVCSRSAEEDKDHVSFF